MPPGLAVDQVWVQPDGRVILVDPLAVDDPSAATEGRPDGVRALALLRGVAALALEGGRRRSDHRGAAIRSPVPLHASALLGVLLGGEDAGSALAAFRDGARETRDLPSEVTLGQRASSLGVLGLSTLVGLATAYGVTYLALAGAPGPAAGGRVVALLAAGLPAIWPAWDGLTRGGFGLGLAGLGLTRWDGRRAARWRCAWRSSLVWLPPTLLLVASLAVRGRSPAPGWLPWAPFGLAAALLPLYVASALLNPSCGPHDRLSGLRVVPR